MERIQKIAFTALCAFACLICTAQGAYSQKASASQKDTLMERSNIKGPLEFNGFVEELTKKLKGAVVTLYESPDGSKDNLTEVLKTVTGGNGQFEFKLEVNKFYMLAVEKQGYTTKKIDFDTDVSKARSEFTSVPKFSFRVDMVQDLDGLAFAGSVASVFYQIKRNVFDYQLDYSKEEMEEEERLLREQEEKRRLAELAAQKKFDIEEAARVLRENENASAQEIIKAAVTVGDGNKDKTVAGFLKVFSDADSLRDRKAVAMYDKLLEERKTSEATGGKIDFQAIFNVAQKLEEGVLKQAQEQRSQSVEVLRKEKEEAARKMNEAMAIQQQSLEIASKERLAAAAKDEELRKAAEEKETRDKVYYAIFGSNGDGNLAVQNLIKTYAKNDPYKEQKAKAIYAEYEKLRVGGTTLSQINFSQLFAAADTAEQDAIQKDIEADNSKQQSKLNAFMDRVEEKKREEQTEIVQKIEEGLKTASSDRISQVAVFKEALPKNDPYKDQKAAVMYDEYVQQKKKAVNLQSELERTPDNKDAQIAVIKKSLSADTPNKDAVAEKMYDDFVKQKQKLGGTGVVNIDFSSLFQVADAAEAKIKQEAKEQLVKEKQQAQDQLEAQRELIRKEKAELAEKTATMVEQSHKAKMADTKNKKEKQLADALEGNGDRDAVIASIMKILDQTGDKELDQERAAAVYDAYLVESQKIKQSGNTGSTLDFAVLFQAADKAELARLERQYEQKQADENERLAEYTERRIEQATEIAKAQQKSAEKQVEQAEIAYEETLLKVEAQRQERLAEQKKKEEELAKSKEMEQTRRIALENEIKDAELAKMEADRKQRLEAEKKEQDALLKVELAARRKQEEEAKKEADLKLAEMEKARLAAEESARLAEAARMKEEEKRLAIEEKSRREAEGALAKEAEEARRLEAQRLKDEEKRLADQQKAKEAAELAAKKEVERKKQEEAQRLAAEEKALKDAELAAAKSAEEKRLAEEKRVADELKAKEAAELAAQKEAERKKQEEAQRIAAEAKARQEAELAATKSAEEKRKADEKRIADELKAKEADELAAQKEAERKKQEEAQRVAAEEKARQDAELAAAKAAEEERKAEVKRQAELAKQKAEQDEKQRLANYESLVVKGDGAFSTKDYQLAIRNYKDAKQLYPENKDLAKKLSDTEIQLDRIAKEEADKLALDTQYNTLMKDGESAVSSEDYKGAIAKFEQALALKPNEQGPKQKIKDANRALEQIAQAEKEKQANERKFVLLMQQGNTALASNDLSSARKNYEDAAVLKPSDAEPKSKLAEVASRERELATAELEKKKKEEEAKKKFEEQQKLEEERKAKELQARIDAIDQAQSGTAASKSSEESRIEKYEKLKETIEQLDLAAEEQRRAFLSELAKIYPEGMTKEQVDGKNFVLLRHVINSNNIVTIYEKKTWDWGGVFYFKDSDIAITEAIYKLEIGKYQ